ncbi:hypothetical protein L6164_034056 [Bauhinia variegata]|uniref:Uncharacterized protein n=1 Tax=Bauhinia variegata TaxID=167791 RepID=A0ACB9KTS0_BAUVA|nr:hypothetical protein L6164_034056 [Bauhinia variegata]
MFCGLVTLNNPPMLKGWNGSDPCQESWTGVECSGSSVIHLEIQGLNLSGHLGGLLYNLQNLKENDVSSNNIVGEIPFGLPPSATYINMASNFLSQNIPPSLTTMKKLRHLNLSHNFLSGPVGDVFSGLNDLREMDLSHNNFSGDLPHSFGSLSNLSKLFLQNNRFSGSVTYLAELPLTDLNIQYNHFSGIIPQHFQSIQNLWIGGNKFHAWDNSSPWAFPMASVPLEHNISRPPTNQSNAIKNPSPKVTLHKKHMDPGGIAFMVGGGILLATGFALFIAIHLNRLRAQRLKNLESSNKCSLQSHPTSATLVSSTALGESPRIPPFNSASLLGAKRLPPVHYNRREETSRGSFSKKCRFPPRIKVYTLAELQFATNSFREENLLGEGYIGPVYKAEFPDGQIFAVKNINMTGLSLNEGKFLDAVCTASRLRHPNLVALNGYCLEHGQHLLVYDYVRNLTLHDALHGQVYKPLSSALCLQIALGVSQALDYMHSFSPPVAHGNLKAASILLDDNLKPRVCDCGLAIFRPLTSNGDRIKVSPCLILQLNANGETGYIAPDHAQPGIGSGNPKSDIFAYGVLLLELLTGRKPFDNSRPREEQHLVKWASSRLHDNESLEQMVFPGIKRTFSPKALPLCRHRLPLHSGISTICFKNNRCVFEPVKEFRPPMSEVVDSLTTFSQKLKVAKIEVAEV